MNINFSTATLYGIIALFIITFFSGIIFVATAPEGTFDEKSSWEYTDKGKKYDKNKDGMIACTEEARVCPDGTSVGRVPPSCEFAACPRMNQGGGNDLDGVVCTMDARMCPDGSFVGRVPPSCEFAACVGASQSAE